MSRKKITQELNKPGIAEMLTQFLEQYPHHILSSILFLALILRVLALLSLKESIYFDFLLWDERLYHSWAEKIANGTFQSSSVYEMAPLPAYFMAFVYRLFSPDVIYIRIANILFGVVSCYLIYLIGKEMLSKTVGLFACLIAALYEPFIFYNIVPLKTSLSLILFSAMIYSLVAALNRRSILYALFLGFFMGLVNNVRPNAVVLVPLLFLLIFWVLYRDKASLKIIIPMLVLYVCGLALSHAPFMIRNYQAAGVPSATTSQGGFHLYATNNFSYRNGIPFKTTSPAEQGIQFTIEASRRVGKKLTPQEASSYWIGKAVDESLEHPLGILKRYMVRTLKLFNWFEKGDHYDIGFISEYVRFFKTPLFTFWMILPLGMAGMMTTGMRSKRLQALILIFLLYGSTQVLFFTNIRMRIPLLIILIPYAAAGIYNLFISFNEHNPKTVKTYFSVLLFFLIIEFIPVQDSRDMTAFLNTHAIILNSKGLKGEAQKYWEDSSRLEKHYSAFANMSLAGIYLKKGNVQKGLDSINKVSDDSFAAAMKYDMIGDVKFRQGKIIDAVVSYEKALDINSGLRPTRLKLIKALWKIDKQRALEESDRLEYIESFYVLYGSKK